MKMLPINPWAATPAGDSLPAIVQSGLISWIDFGLSQSWDGGSVANNLVAGQDGAALFGNYSQSENAFYSPNDADPGYWDHYFTPARPTSNGPYTIGWVAKYDSFANYTGLIGQTTGSFQGHSSSSGTWYIGKGATASTRFQTSSGYIPTGSWVSVVYTNSSSNSCRLYRNGLLTHGPSTQASTADYSQVQAATGSLQTRGRIRAFFVYDRDISAAEVLENHNAYMTELGI